MAQQYDSSAEYRHYRLLSSQAFRRWALRRFPRCQWCNRPLSSAGATTDHLLPKSKGGGDERSNLCLACIPCNWGRSSQGNGERPPFGPADWQKVWDAEHEKAEPEKSKLVTVWVSFNGGRWCNIRHGLTGGEAKKTMDMMAKKYRRNGPETIFLVTPDGERPQEEDADHA